MMKMILASIALAACSTAVASPLPNSKEPNQAAVVSNTNMPQEAQDAIKALRAMEAKMETGLPYAGYVTELANLNVALVALEEAAAARNLAEIPKRTAEIKSVYSLIRDFWKECLSPQSCKHGAVIVGKEGGIAGLYAELILKMYPELNTDQEGGAVFYSKVSKNVYAHKSKLISALLSDAAEKSKALRIELLKQ